MSKTYLGDSVYADYDGFHVVLTTENGASASNTIALDAEVLVALHEFEKSLTPAGHDALPSNKMLAENANRAFAYQNTGAETIKRGLAHLAAIDPKVSETCDLNAFGGAFWFTVSNRDDVVELLRLAPNWRKSTHETGIDYNATVDGVEYKVRTITDALPPTCRLVEVEVDVPSTVIAAHKVKRVTVECIKVEEADEPEEDLSIPATGTNGSFLGEGLSNAERNA